MLPSTEVTESSALSHDGVLFPKFVEFFLIPLSSQLEFRQQERRQGLDFVASIHTNFPEIW